MSKVLIFGTASGIGQALCQLYQSKGWQVQGFTRKDCDLASPQAVTNFINAKDRWTNGATLCIFCAGTSDVGYADNLVAQDYRTCLEVNFLAPLEIFRALAISPQNPKHFVFVLSGLADLAVPGMSPYSISKRALRDYLNFIKLEESFADCRILKVWPGPVKTSFNQKTRIHGDFKLPQQKVARSADEVAAKIYAAQQSGASCLTLSPLPRLVGYVQQLCAPLVTGLFALSRKFERPKRSK